jgi:hypothetical protein
MSDSGRGYAIDCKSDVIEFPADEESDSKVSPAKADAVIGLPSDMAVLRPQDGYHLVI